MRGSSRAFASVAMQGPVVVSKRLNDSTTRESRGVVIESLQRPGASA